VNGLYPLFISPLSFKVPYNVKESLVASSPLSKCCDVSPQPTGCCCVFALRLRMVQCVLSPAQVAEQAVIVQKVDLHDPPPTEDVHNGEEATLSHPPHTVQVSPSFPVGDFFSPSC
jgi:hypothetical protein